MTAGPRDPSAGDGLIDVHTHAFPPSLPDLEAADPWGRWPSVERLTESTARVLVGGRAYRDIDSRCWSAERRVADMDAESVARQVVSPTPVTFCHDAPPDGARILARAQNEFLAGLVAQRPDRFTALGAVPLQDPEQAVAELRHCVEVLGFAGAEIGTRVGDLELGDPVLDPFFDAAADLGALVLVHPADTTLDPRLAVAGVAFGAGMPTETGIAAAALPAARPGRLAVGALVFAALVELFRLVHAPGLDAFRLTTAGALLLGRVFSPWNLLCYAAGIAAAWAWDRGERRIT